MKPARLRLSAKQDLSDAAVYYADRGGEALGENLLAQALSALARIESMPGIGSPDGGQRPAHRIARLAGVAIEGVCYALVLFRA